MPDIKSIFSGILQLQDKNKRKLSEMFLKLPSKKEYPDYYEIIKSPISLAEIKKKMNSNYKSEEFIADIEKMAENAKTYNEETSPIALDAKKILEYVEKEVKDTSPDLRKIMKSILSLKKDNHKVCEYFLELPNESDYPEYYDIIKSPISLMEIQEKIDTESYLTFKKFQVDMEKLVSNAMMFNEPGSRIYEDAKEIETFLQTFTKEKCETLNSVVVNSKEYKIGDFALISPNNIIGQIHQITSTPNDKTTLLVNQFLVPSQTIHQSTRKFFPNEIFKSDIFLTVDSSDVISKQYVLFIKEYVRGKPKNCSSDDIVYVCESRYNSSLKKMDKIKIWAHLGDKYELDLYDAPLNLERRISSPFVLDQGSKSTISDSANSSRRGTLDGGDFRKADPLFKKTFKALANYHIDNHWVSELFQELPDEDEYPDYYDVIESPIALSDIKRKLDKYTSLLDMKKDVELMVNNAKSYNAPESQVYEDAINLMTYFNTLITVSQSEKQEPVPRVVVNSVEYKIGNFVILSNNVIGQITKINVENDGIFTLNHFLTPRQTVHPTTRRFYPNELFKSDIFVEYSSSQIADRVYVLWIKDYMKGKKPKELSNKKLYVCESKYNSSSKEIEKIKIWMVIGEKDDLEYTDEHLDLEKLPSPFLEKKLQPDSTADSSRRGSSASRTSYSQIFQGIPKVLISKMLNRNGSLLLFSGPPLDIQTPSQVTHSLDYLMYKRNNNNNNNINNNEENEDMDGNDCSTKSLLLNSCSKKRKLNMPSVLWESLGKSLDKDCQFLCQLNMKKR